MKLYFLLVSFFLMLALPVAHTQSISKTAKHQLDSLRSSLTPVSISLNPSFYVLGGHGIKLFYHLPKKWSFGAALEANFQLPTFALNQFFDHTGGITVNWDFLVGIDVRYRFTKSALNKGFYLTGTFGYEGWTVRTTDAALEDQFTNFYASVGAGFNWYPFKQSYFYIGASYNLIFILNNNTERQLGTERYTLRWLVPPSFYPTIYIGGRF